MTDEDQNAIQNLRSAAIALAQAIIADADALIDELPGGELIAALNEGCDHEWETMGGREDARIDKCAICNLERWTDLGTGKETYYRS